jgi:hypothetical protein
MGQEIHYARWFGRPLGFPMNHMNRRVDVPVGRICESCKVAINATDQGIITGPVGHDALWHVACYHRHGRPVEGVMEA